MKSKRLKYKRENELNKKTNNNELKSNNNDNTKKQQHTTTTKAPAAVTTTTILPLHSVISLLPRNYIFHTLYNVIDGDGPLYLKVNNIDL